MTFYDSSVSLPKFLTKAHPNSLLTLCRRMREGSGDEDGRDASIWKTESCVFTVLKTIVRH